MRHIAVLGLGNFGSTVARSLTEKGAYVTAIDQNKDRVEEIKDSVSTAIALDTTDKKALTAVDIQDVDVAVVCIGEDVEANILTTFLLKKLGVKKIWARAIDPLQQEILKTLEIGEIINLEEEMGEIVAGSLVSTSLTKHIPLSQGHSIAEIKVPGSFIGRSIADVKPREKFNVNIIAIKKKIPSINEAGERILVDSIEDVPPPDRIFEEENVLLIVGSDDNIKRLAGK